MPKQSRFQQRRSKVPKVARSASARRFFGGHRPACLLCFSVPILDRLRERQLSVPHSRPLRPAVKHATWIGEICRSRLVRTKRRAGRRRDFFLGQPDPGQRSIPLNREGSGTTIACVVGFQGDASRRSRPQAGRASTRSLVDFDRLGGSFPRWHSGFSKSMSRSTKIVSSILTVAPASAKRVNVEVLQLHFCKMCYEPTA